MISKSVLDVALLISKFKESQSHVMTAMPYYVMNIKIQRIDMFEIKCADCGCLPAECKQSKFAKECPNCTWDECCCWKATHA